MGYEGNLQTVPGLTAGADLSSDQFKFGKVSSGGVIVASVSGEPVDGVIQDAPSAAGRAVSLGYSGVSKVKAGAAIAKGARIQPNASGLAITAAPAASAATKDGGVGPYNMAAGDTLVIDVDNAGNATCTWDAAAGYVDDTTTTYPCADQDGLTVIVAIDGGDNQTITFSGATTTLASILAQMNAQLVGASAVDNGSTQPRIRSDSQGTGSTVSNPTGTSLFTSASDAPVAGTGDVVSIDAVTAAEVETVIEADSTAEITVNGDGSITITSPTTGATSELDFISGNALAILGFSVETLVGAASGAQFAGKALEAASASGDIIAALLINGLNV